MFVVKINTMAHSRYYLDYLKSDKWQRIRKLKLKLEKYRCAHKRRKNCQGYLQVHHLHYRNLGNERLADLMVLCKLHHGIADRQRKWLKNQLKQP